MATSTKSLSRTFSTQPAGIKYNAEKGKKVDGELAGKELQSLIAEGSKKLATMPSKDGGAAAASAASAARGAAPAVTKTEEKK